MFLYIEKEYIYSLKEKTLLPIHIELGGYASRFVWETSTMAIKYGAQTGKANDMGRYGSI
ncbi:MAG: hypothetical protein ACLT16_19865 [[Clostridium] innocuum]